ncbi:MAG TPA: polysaccharide lyase family 8 super-sandwich domain-containing protein [Pirellulaceae bacterium]|nr:polysaccharide lyase family 8 super-sandwich domain-containing protein [Pirellulaceae bacterium]
METLETRAVPTSGLLYSNMAQEIMEQAPKLHPGTAYYLQFMRSDGSFRDLNYSGKSDASAGDLQGHGKRLETLTLSLKWNDPSNPYYNSPWLQSQILKGWNYVAYKGGSVNAPNWWWKAIGVPQGMAQGLILMRDEMSPAVRSQVLKKYFGSVWSPSKYDGANVTSQAPLAMIDGLLRGNTSRIREVVNRVSAELNAYGGEGIQRDLSFQQHRLNGKLNYYSGHYGLLLAKDSAQIMRWTGGTDFAFGGAAIHQELRFLLDHLQWLTRGDTFDVASMGRIATSHSALSNAAGTLNDALVDMLTLGSRTDELTSAIERYTLGSSDANSLSGSKALWRSDGMAWQRPNMLATLRMLSNRTLRPETAAGQNARGFFEGDGFTLLVQDGDELGGSGESSILPVWDWQRLPGTTVQHNGWIPNLDMFKTSTNSTGGSNLVGSASDGNYGVALMDYRRGGVSLTARKSWFFFDDEIVALGSDIDDAQASAPVFTSLNQVLLDGPVTVQDAAGRRTFELGGSASLSGGAWIHHDDLGYVVLDASSRTTVQAQMQWGGGLSLPVFSAWVDHGARPQNQTYAYAVVPGVSPDELDAYTGQLPIQILNNTPTIQAVRHLGLNQTQIAFYSAGATMIDDTTWIAVSQPALVIVRQVGDDLVITASDPRQQATSLTIDVNRQLIGPGAKWQPDAQTTRITMALPALPYQGASATATYFGLPADPIDEPAPVNAVAVPAQADAAVRTGSYADTPDGNSAELAIQNFTTGYTRESFVRFDTSAIVGEIVSAEVRLTAVSGANPVLISAAPTLDDAWQESSITWNSKPASGPEIGRASVSQGQVAAFDVTSLVREAVGSDDLFSLRLASPTQGYYLVGFASREHADVALRPVLEVITRPSTIESSASAEGESRTGLSLTLGDYLSLATSTSSAGPVLGPTMAGPSTSDRRMLRIGAASDGDVWDPSVVDLALGQY